MKYSPQDVSAHKITLSICDIPYFKIPAHIAGKILAHIADGNIEMLSNTVACCPAATMNIVRLAQSKDITLTGNNGNIRNLITKIDIADIATEILNNEPANTNIAEFETLNAFTLSSAIAATNIAQQTNSDIMLARSAALLSAIGNLALLQLYPKTFISCKAEAGEKNIAPVKAQQLNMGTNQILLGKRLAETFHLTPDIAEAIWLQRATETVIETAAKNKTLAYTTRLATAIAKHLNIGDNGNFAKPKDIYKMAHTLDLTAEQLDSICTQTTEQYNQVASVINTEPSKQAEIYNQGLRKIAATGFSKSLDTIGTQLKFIEKLSEKLQATTSVTAAQKALANTLAEIFDIQKTCIILKTSSQQLLQALISENGNCQNFILSPAENFDFNNATMNDFTPWIFEQIVPAFNLAHTNYYPLKIANSVIGGFFCQTTSMIDLSRCVNFAASTIAKVVEAENYKFLSENLIESTVAQAVTDFEPPLGSTSHDAIIEEHITEKTKSISTEQPESQTQQNLFESLAELAAGAAHELNNPLAVISGRIQLLSRDEDNEAKKIAYEQITEKIHDLEDIVGGLMNFARPADPQKRTVSPFILISNCIEKLRTRYQDVELNLDIENIETLPNVTIDTDQITTAIVEILYNALESYDSGNGQINISGQQHSDEYIQIIIADSGCGMDDEILKKATDPFYSNKAAGRQRGLGLTTAKRLLEINNCKIDITSAEEVGTTITILIPKN